jgi:hypothetical protein
MNTATVTNPVGKEVRDPEDSGPHERHEHPKLWSEKGAEAEVDFADLWIDLCGVRTKVFLFTLRLSSSGRAVHKAFGTQGQEAFLDGHQHAFTELGGYAGVDTPVGAETA